MIKNLYYPDPERINLEALHRMAEEYLTRGQSTVIHHHSSSHPCEDELHEHYDAKPVEVGQ